MRLALPNAAFIGFTGTPLFKHDHLTRRIFGNYVSRYDFKRSEEDRSTVRLVYENRGEKLGIARLDLNDRIAARSRKRIWIRTRPRSWRSCWARTTRSSPPTTGWTSWRMISSSTARHAGRRGKSMLVCIDKITCGRMFQRIEPRWQAQTGQARSLVPAKDRSWATARTRTRQSVWPGRLQSLRGQAQWMEQTIVEMVISEAQNEVRDFARWGFDIVPHRMRMKTGFETPDGKRVALEDAFKDPDHPFRIAIVCAMWLTGFDVECLATLYIDKPMRAHNLMQAIARANRVYPGKECGVIVDYNGMLRGLREALAQYALGDEDQGAASGGVVAPIEDLVAALLQAIEATERHLLGLGFDAARLAGATGFARIAALRDAVDAVYTSDESKRRFEIMARQVFRSSRYWPQNPAPWPMPRATTTLRPFTRSSRTDEIPRT